MTPAARRAVLVLNPTAGKGRALALLPEVVGVLRDAGMIVEVVASRSLAEAESAAREAAAGPAEVLVMMGGDGMMHLGVNAAADVGPTQRKVLGLIPAGTGNDLCRGLGIDPRDPVAAARAVGSGGTRPIDLLRVGDHFVGAVLAAGFDALVNQRANAMSWPRGELRYTLAALAELRTFRPLAYRLTIDGELRELEAMIVAVGNTSSYGGGMQICPDADPTDGIADVTIIHPVSRRVLLQLLPQMRSGRFARHSCVERLRARQVRVEADGVVGFGDGEALGLAPFTVTLVPAAVEICGELRPSTG